MPNQDLLSKSLFEQITTEQHDDLEAKLVNAQCGNSKYVSEDVMEMFPTPQLEKESVLMRVWVSVCLFSSVCDCFQHPEVAGCDNLANPVPLRIPALDLSPVMSQARSYPKAVRPDARPCLLLCVSSALLTETGPVALFIFSAFILPLSSWWSGMTQHICTKLPLVPLNLELSSWTTLLRKWWHTIQTHTPSPGLL